MNKRYTQSIYSNKGVTTHFSTTYFIKVELVFIIRGITKSSTKDSSVDMFPLYSLLTLAVI